MPYFLCHGPARFFQNVPDQTDCARHHAQATADFPVKAHLAAQRANRACGVGGQWLAGSQRRLIGHSGHQREIGAVKAGLAGQLKQPWGAWINRLVDGVADARHDALLGLKIVDHCSCQGDRVGRFVRRGHGFIEHFGGSFNAAHKHRAQAIEPSRHRALQRLRRAQVRHARHDGTGCHAVLYQRHDHRVEHARFALVRETAREFQETHVAEIELAQNLGWQILAKDGDAGGVAPANVGAHGFGFSGHGVGLLKLVGCPDLRGIQGVSTATTARTAGVRSPGHCISRTARPRGPFFPVFQREIWL